MGIAVLLVPEGAPLAITLEDVLAGSGVVAARSYLPGMTAFGAVGADDPLDAAADPAIDRDDLQRRLHLVPERALPPIVDALVDREAVLDLSSRNDWRPPTLFEHRALADVIEEFIELLPPSRVRIDRAPLRGGLNHCEMGHDGIARIRLLATNGKTLAGRTHALVHEMGHALVGVARHDGRSYGAPYGAPGYRRFLRSNKLCDEEALVRAIADAWLLRRNVAWARTWPGAIDDDGRDLDGGELARFARQQLARGLASAE